MYLYFTHPSRSQTDVKVGWVTSTFDTKGSFIFFQFTMKFGNKDTSIVFYFPLNIVQVFCDVFDVK